MTDVWISKSFDGATRRFQSGGYQANEGYFVPNTLAKFSNLDMTNPENKLKLFPLQTPTPQTRWVESESNGGTGRPTLDNKRFEPCPKGDRIDHKSTQKQNVITHQKGWRSVEGGGTDSTNNIHGWQWSKLSVKPVDTTLIDPTNENSNWEGSRFKYGRYDVPGRLGFDLQGAKASLQRDHGFTLTEYYRPSGNRAGGYLAGRNGISNDFGALPSNVSKGPKQPN